MFKAELMTTVFIHEAWMWAKSTNIEYLLHVIYKKVSKEKKKYTVRYSKKGTELLINGIIDQDAK